MQNNQAPGNAEVPAAVYQQASAYQLGALLAIYKPFLSNPLAAIGMMIGVVIVDIILLVALAMATGYIYYILIILPIAAVIYGIRALMNSDLRVYHFSYGLLRVKGNQTNPIRWDQVASVVQQKKRRQTYTVWGGLVGAMIARSRGTDGFTIQCNDGTTFKFDSVLHKLAQLGQTIQQAVTQQHMPRAVAAFNAGNFIPFGPLTVSMQGLGKGNELLPWHEVQSVEIKQQLIVKRVGKMFNWASIDVSQIPNVLVLMELTNYARSGRAPVAQPVYPGR